MYCFGCWWMGHSKGLPRDGMQWCLNMGIVMLVLLARGTSFPGAAKGKPRVPMEMGVGKQLIYYMF